MPKTIEWKQLKGEVDNILNVTATKDGPVGFLCAALRFIPGLGMGTAGYHGFDDPAVDNIRLEGGHGVALEPQHRANVAGYLIGNEFKRDGSEPKIPPLMELFSSLAVPSLATAAVLLFGLYWLIASIPYGTGWTVFVSAMVTFFLVWLLQKV